MTSDSGNADSRLPVTALHSRRAPWCWLATAMLALAQAACDAPAPPAPEPPAPAAMAGQQIELAGPTVIAFLPSEAEQAGGEGAAEAVGHVRFAMTDTAQCIGYGKTVLMTTVFAERLTIRDGPNQQTIELRDLGQGIGAVLAEPGRPSKVVHTEVGASSLQHLLPQAVFEYWKLPDCKRD